MSERELRRDPAYQVGRYGELLRQELEGNQPALEALEALEWAQRELRNAPREELAAARLRA